MSKASDGSWEDGPWQLTEGPFDGKTAVRISSDTWGKSNVIIGCLDMSMEFVALLVRVAVPAPDYHVYERREGKWLYVKTLPTVNLRAYQMSKASEWAKAYNRRPTYEAGPYSPCGRRHMQEARVAPSGVLEMIDLEGRSIFLSDTEAVAYARWILDTFGETPSE